MRTFSTLFISLCSVSGSLGLVKRATPSLYLVGDSTTALQSASSGIQGWGVEIPTYLQNINIVNNAVSGSSARTWYRDGFWYNTQALFKSGDYVIIELGHNDGGTPDTSERASVYGETDTATQTVTLANGTTEVVHTWPFYIKSFITSAQAKGAIPIISSQTPDNPYENSTTIIDDPPRFVGYAKDVAAAKSVDYVDHFAAVISAFTVLGKATVDAYYPIDHTHTNTAGAIQVARALISGLKCASANSVLTAYFNSAGEAAAARC